jgi:hypothetical protein
MQVTRSDMGEPIGSPREVIEGEIVVKVFLPLILPQILRITYPGMTFG